MQTLKKCWLVPLALLCPACCPPICIGNCHAVPSADAVAPMAKITIEYWDQSQQVHVEEITSDSSVDVSEDRRFNVIYSATDNVGVKSLALDMRWTQYAGGVPQLVQPLISPKTFSSACSPRSDATKFTWEDSPRVYRFRSVAEDFHGSGGFSPQLTVVHGNPPGPIVIP